MSEVIEIKDEQFNREVLESDKPVLAYFWASWCGPCRLVSPSVKWVAENYGDRLKVVKLEVNDPKEKVASEQKAVAKYKVEGLPALRFFKNKELVKSHEGAITKQKLQDWIDSDLN